MDTRLGASRIWNRPPRARLALVAAAGVRASHRLAAAAPWDMPDELDIQFNERLQRSGIKG
jgi:hypothetical protein